MSGFVPPPFPPPLLSDLQLISLVEQGYVDLTLPSHLSDLHTALFSATNSFFSLPTATKQRLFPTNVTNTEHGFYVVPQEKQYLTLRHSAHPREHSDGSDQLVRLVAELWSENVKFLRRALYDVGKHLGFPPHAWDSLLKDCDALPDSAGVATPSLLRMFEYLPDAGVADPHKDLGLLTLCVGAGKGLQICARSRDDENQSQIWQDAPTVTMLAGDLLHVLSSGRVVAGLHRVVGNSHGRSSIVFALRMNTRHEIDLAMFGGQGIIPATELWDGIRKGRINVNAQKDIREKEREAFRRTHSG